MLLSKGEITPPCGTPCFPVDRLLTCLLRPVSIGPRFEIRFKDRLQNELERTLDHTITNCRNRKNAYLTSPVLRNLLLSHSHGLIRFVDQFILYLFQKTLPSAFFDGRKRNSVDSRSPVITLRHQVGFLECFRFADMNV